MPGSRHEGVQARGRPRPRSAATSANRCPPTLAPPSTGALMRRRWPDFMEVSLSVERGSVRLGLPQVLVAWVTMLITREGDRCCRLPPRQSAQAGPVHLAQARTLPRSLSAWACWRVPPSPTPQWWSSLLADRTPGLLNVPWETDPDDVLLVALWRIATGLATARPTTNHKHPRSGVNV